MTSDYLNHRSVYSVLPCDLDLFTYKYKSLLCRQTRLSFCHCASGSVAQPAQIYSTSEMLKQTATTSETDVLL